LLYFRAAVFYRKIRDKLPPGPFYPTQESTMKDWNYYDTPQAAYFGFEYSNNYRQELIARIEQDKLTAEERKEALARVGDQVRKHMRELNQPHNDESVRLLREFWEDARQELGYGDRLESRGVAALEDVAYEEGHAYGLSEVFSRLRDLVSLMEDILANQKQPLKQALQETDWVDLD
jgi:hypothetical protein